jgi:hypothetical protein
MKYMITVFETTDYKNYNITTTPDDVVFTSFPAVIGNPNYDQFLEKTKLTDKKVHALTPDEWYDFPEETVE